MSLGQKCFGSKEIWSLKKFGFKKFDSKRNYHFENLISFNQNKFWQNFGSRKIWVKRGFSLKKFEYQRIWSKKIGRKKLFGRKKIG